MNTDKTYIKPFEADELDKMDEPSKDELILMLDNPADFEYTTPYTDNDDFSDLFGSGEQYEVGGIFDDR